MAHTILRQQQRALKRCPCIRQSFRGSSNRARRCPGLRLRFVRCLVAGFHATAGGEPSVGAFDPIVA